VNEAKRRIRVGALILVAAIGLAAGLVAIKGSAALIGSTVELTAAFEDVGGLLPGASVRLAGMQVGQVSEVYLPDDATEVVVEMTIDDSYLLRIRRDSVATIATRGLLGDPLIEISLGSPEAPPVADGDRLKSQGPRGLKEMVGALEKGTENVEEISLLLKERLEMMLTEELAKDIGRIARSTADILDGVKEGPGLAHELIYDEALAGEATRTLAAARRALVRLDGAVGAAERIVAEVETGDGLLHAAIYDERAGDALAELAGAMEELHRLMGDAREGAGGRGIGQDLAASAATLRRLMEEIDRGKGTVGALIKDPTVYRDLKQLLGEVRRNVILRSLVRMTIAQDDLERD
jgi:phospholipid/cholesterol/gamma-HCH transport system substrate-binding protein